MSCVSSFFRYVKSVIQHGLLTAVGSGLLASVVCPLTFDISGVFCCYCCSTVPCFLVSVVSVLEEEVVLVASS